MRNEPEGYNLRVLLLLAAVGCFILAIIDAAAPTTILIGTGGWVGSGLLASTLARW